MTRARADTWMPLYVADYLKDTSRLTTAQHGAYLLLIMEAWTHNGLIPADDLSLAMIARMAPRDWKANRAKVLAFWTPTEDGLSFTHKRIADEIAKARAISEKRSEVGRQGASRRWQADGKSDGNGMANAMANASQNDAPSHKNILPPTPLAGGKPKSDRRKPRTAIPDGFPTPEAIAEQQQRCRIDGADIDVAYQAERFRNWAIGNDARYADWEATWRNWIAKAVKDPPGLRFGGQHLLRQPLTTADDESPDLWAIRLRQWRSDVPWDEVSWGPTPGAPRCRCPVDMLTTSERNGDGPERKS